MRNPIRPKNLNARFLPLYLLGMAILVLHVPDRRALWWALPLIAAGALLRGWGAGHLVKNDVLTTTGPYAYLRHPLYAGTILIGTGFAVAVGGLVTLGVLLCLWPWFALRYFPRKERIESARLSRLYGARFDRYRREVPALWPRLRGWREEAAAEGAPEVGWGLDRYSDNNELGTLLAVLAGWLAFYARAGFSV